MLRDPSLTPEPWRARRPTVHPLLLVPIVALVGLVIVVDRALGGGGLGAWVTVGHLAAVTLIATAFVPWHVPRRPIHDPAGRAVSFAAPRPLGLLPVGLVLWGVILVVHFELMRDGRLEQVGPTVHVGLPWWTTLPIGVLLVGVGLYLARPMSVHRLTLSAAGIVVQDPAGHFAARWEQIRTLVPVLERGSQREIEVDAPDVIARDHRGRPTAPMIHPGLLDTDAVRLWLTLAHYHHHPHDRPEIGRAAGRRRRAQWRWILPTGPATKYDPTA